MRLLGRGPPGRGHGLRSVTAAQPSPDGGIGDAAASSNAAPPPPPHSPESGHGVAVGAMTPGGGDSSRSAVAVATLPSDCRELLEVQGHAQRLLAAVFGEAMGEEAAVALLEEQPELAWLAHCMQRCPMPLGWASLRAEGPSGVPCYVDLGADRSTSVMPFLEQFVDLARLLGQWRSRPGEADGVIAALASRRDVALAEAKRLRSAWHGPHRDALSGTEYWHCEETGRSSWGDPGAAAEFLAKVAEQLRTTLSTGTGQAQHAGVRVATPGRDGGHGALAGPDSARRRGAGAGAGAGDTGGGLLSWLQDQDEEVPALLRGLESARGGTVRAS